MIGLLKKSVCNAQVLILSLLVACPIAAQSIEIIEYNDSDYAADNDSVYEYSDDDYAADNDSADEYSDADYAADQYDETAYARENFRAYPDVERSDEEDEGDDDAEDESDDETEALAGDYEALIIPEATLSYDKSNDEASPGELSANIYGYYQMMVTEDVEFIVEGEINTQSSDPDDHLALVKPALNINSIGFNYYTDFGGVGIGKFDLLRDESLFDAIWARQLYGRENLPASDLDLSNVIGARAWIDLEDILPGSHMLYVGAFFQDNTFLNEDYLSRSGNPDERITGLGYTRRLNNWMVSLIGGDFDTLPGWEYVLGATLLTNNSPDSLDLDEDDDGFGLDVVDREMSFFSGLYGEFELSDRLEVSPLVEVLYRDGADGFDQNVFSFAAGISLNQGNWTYGGYYSNRRTFDKTEEAYFYDSQLQAFISYTFESGIYLDIEHQRNIFDSEKSNATFVSLGIPITFSSEGNLYGRRRATSSDDPKSNVRRFIRRR